MAFTVQEILVSNPVTLRPEQSVFSAKELMLLNGFECLYVVDKAGKPVGVMSALVAGVEDKSVKVQKLMSDRFATVREGQSVKDAAQLFASKRFDHPVLPVVDGAGVLIGLVRIRDIVKDLAFSDSQPLDLTPEALVVQIAMTHTEKDEREWSRRAREQGYASAVTQVGTTAEKLPVKLRESAIVAGIANAVISEDSREKMALSNAIREIVLQMETISPGLGGGYKVAMVRGEGRISVAACGRCGHALVSSQEQIFLGTSTI